MSARIWLWYPAYPQPHPFRRSPMRTRQPPYTAHELPLPVQPKRPHSVDLGGLHRGHSWAYVVPSKRIRPRDCDELPDEFKRAGIGVCFEGTRQNNCGNDQEHYLFNVLN